MNPLRRIIKAAFDSRRYIRSTMAMLSGGTGARRPDFDYKAAVNSYRSWVYAAANLNAVAVASVPLRLYVRSGGGAKLWRTSKVASRSKAYLSGSLAQRPSARVIRKAAEMGEGFEVVTDTHPILELLSKVNPYQNGYDATVLRVLHTELTGNAYLHPVMDRELGIPVELWPMFPQWTEIVPGDAASGEFISGYRYGATEQQKQDFAPDEVIHFRRPNPANLYYGIGKAEAAWAAIMSNLAVHEMDLAFFENKGRPDWLLTIKSDASPEELERLEVEIESKLRGRSRTGRFLTATADIDIKPLSFPPKDLAGRDEIVEEIAAVFGVPVSMLKANDPNLASSTTGFAQWKETTILPILRMDEETLNQSLIPLFGLEGDAFLAYDNPVVEDERFALELRRSAVAGGWMTVNEARVDQGLERSDDPAADLLLFSNQPLGGPPPAAPMPLPASEAPLAAKATDEAAGRTDAPRQDARLLLGAIEEKDALSDCVSEKIPKLISEGYPQDQAVAIAYSMCAEGKSFDDAISALERGEAVREKAISDIDTRPPQSVADNARRALEVRATKPESQRGMTAVGIARARDLQNRKPLSEDTIRRMLAYFERHQSDKQGETWDEQGKGWQAWNGWGGDDGWSWARRKVEQFDREREKRIERGKIRKSCGCGCKSRYGSTDAATVESKDCGTGAGGFQPGNTCGEGDGPGGDDAESKPLRVVETDAGHKIEEFKADAESPLDVLNDETDKKSDIVVDWDSAKDRVEKDALDGTSARESMKKYEANLYRVFTDMSPDAPEVNEAMIFASNHEPERHGGMSNTEYNERSLSTPKQAEQEIRRMVDEGTFFSQDDEDNLKPSEKEDKIQIAEANRRIELMSALDGERAERAESALKSIRNELETKVAESRLKCCVRLLRGIRNLDPSQLEEMIQSGFVSHEGLNSWTTDRKVADLFLGGDREGGVLLVTKSPKVGWVNMMDSRQEKEVVRPPSSMRISKVTRTKSGTIIEVEEDEDYDGTR